MFFILTFFYFDTSRCFASAGINLEVENIFWYKIYVGTIYMIYVFCYIHIFHKIFWYEIYVSTTYMIYVFLLY